LLGSTGPFFMFSLEEAFELLSEAGFDGVELMITQDRMSQDPHRMAAVARRYGLPVPAIHGPFLLATWLVFGTDPKGKLDRCVEFAETAGVSTIIIHPPYRWQISYASWLSQRIKEIREQTGITVAVENMFPVWMNGRRLQFQSGIELQELEQFPYVTLDLSHLAVAGIDILEAYARLAERVAHVHVSNNAGRGRDTHAGLDEGVLPVETFLKSLMTSGFPGGITLELDVRPWADDRPALLEFLRSNVEAARRYLEAGAASAVERVDPVGR
jgi:sugar phosphate isomerase/epimerase